MPFKEEHEIDRFDYRNPQLLEGLAQLENMRIQRANIAVTAARYIIDDCAGETTDLGLYAAAMYGRSLAEGISEEDPRILSSLKIARMIKDPKVEGSPLMVRSNLYPDSNATVGVVASLESESYDPIKFLVEPVEDNLSAWSGKVVVGIRKVEPGGKDDYCLAEEVTAIPVSETITFPNGGNGLMIHFQASGGVEVGEAVHCNSRQGRQYYHKLAFWLGDHLAPTEPKALNQTDIVTRRIYRDLRMEAVEQGLSEAEVSFRGLTPTLEAFLLKVLPYADSEEPQPINTKTLFRSWHDPYDAQSLLHELMIRDLVEVADDSKVYLSALGLETIAKLSESLA